MNLKEELQQMTAQARAEIQHRDRKAAQKWADKFLPKLPNKLRKEARKGNHFLYIDRSHFNWGEKIKLLEDWCIRNNLSCQFPSVLCSFRIKWQ